MAESNRILIIPVAGISSRFAQSIGRDVLKCIYYEQQPDDALVYRLIRLAETSGFQKIILVGGYRFEELQNFLAAHIPPGTAEISLVRNALFESTGTLYSFIIGLKEALRDADCREVVLVEGDLVIDQETLNRVTLSPKNVITSCPVPITAGQSVVFYSNDAGELRYVYDTEHRVLNIPAPFRAIYNSGQVWKFRDLVLLQSILDELTPDLLNETNLGFIERYFSRVSSDLIEIIQFKEWHNCNTVEDFRTATTRRGTL
jgi:choline kinase